MRLIDADKLIEICRKGWKLFGGEDEKLKHWADECDIRSQPTIEAIPIEFLVNTIPEYSKRYGPVHSVVIGNLIEDWEKESGK